MPTKKPRLLITFDKEIIDDIEDIRFEQRFPSRNAALNEIIKRGLEVMRNESAAEVESLRRQLEAAKAAAEASNESDENEA